MWRVKGSQRGYGGRRRPQKVEDPRLDGPGGVKPVAPWEGAGLEEEAEP